jgi:hypothetical protein
MMALDLVVSSDTAIPHLAGSAGTAGFHRARTDPRLALAGRAGRLSMVSDCAAIPATQARRLDGRFRPHRLGRPRDDLGANAVTTSKRGGSL